MGTELDMFKCAAERDCVGVPAPRTGLIGEENPPSFLQLEGPDIVKTMRDAEADAKRMHGQISALANSHAEKLKTLEQVHMEGLRAAEAETKYALDQKTTVFDLQTRLS